MGELIVPIATEDFRQAFDLRLREFWDEIGGRFPMNTPAESVFFDLTEFVQRPGKRLRPWLFVEFYRHFSGDQQWNAAGIMRGAIALELLHAFILSHDDIVDRAEDRRGLASLQKVFSKHFGKHKESSLLGQNLALIGGDILFTLAYDALLGSGFLPERLIEGLRYFSSAVTKTGVGEVMEIYISSKEIESVKVEIVEQIYHLKTTYYTLIMPMRLAGIVSGAEAKVMEMLESALIPIGLAFQMENDLQDFWRLERGLWATDLTEGRKTLLLCMAYEALNEVDRTLLQLCLSDAEHHESSILRIAALIKKSGVLSRMRNRQLELLCAAQRELQERDSWQPLFSEIVARMGLLNPPANTHTLI